MRRDFGVQCVSFIAALGTAALSHIKPASPWISYDSYHAQGRDKRDALFSRLQPYLLLKPKLCFMSESCACSCQTGRQMALTSFRPVHDNVAPRLHVGRSIQHTTLCVPCAV